MYFITCLELKILNSRDYLTPRVSEKGLWSVLLTNPHFTDEKIKVGGLKASLRWHDHEVGTPDKYTKAVGGQCTWQKSP